MSFDLQTPASAPWDTSIRNSCGFTGKVTLLRRKITHVGVCMCDVQALPMATGESFAADFPPLQQTIAMPQLCVEAHRQPRTPTLH